jgi:hypothetical protein
MKAKLLLFISLVLPVISAAQTVDQQKVSQMATAVAHAEGFGVRQAIPTRYHNPGDIKTIPSAAKLPGQKSIGKGGHVVFKNDAAGWAALTDQINKMVDGRSHHFNPDMTIAQVARKYAGNWRPWVKIVTRELDITPTTRLRELLFVYDEPPTIEVPAASVPLLETDYLLPVLDTVGFCNDIHQQNCRDNDSSSQN